MFKFDNNSGLFCSVYPVGLGLASIGGIGAIGAIGGFKGFFRGLLGAV